MVPTRLIVVLCTYNGAEHLRAQLDSLRRQTRLPDRLVVCDDRSTDATPDILRDFAADAPFPVQVRVNPANLGPQQNFSHALGLAEADGDDVLLCCDQDDVWHPHKLSRVEREMLAHPQAGLVACDAEVVDEALRPVGHTLWQSIGFDPGRRRRAMTGPADAARELAASIVVYGCTMAFRAKWRPVALPVPAGLTFDAWISRLVASLAPVRFIDEPLQVYRQHARQVVGVARRSRLAGALQAWRQAADDPVGDEVRLIESLKHALADAGEVSDAVKRFYDGRLKFCRDRSRLRRSPAYRIPGVGLNLVDGSYRKHAKGWRSAALDLVAPFPGKVARRG